MKAVMFDCDGVLVDSEKLIAEILADIARKRGGNISVTEGLQLFAGKQLELCAQLISERLHRDVADEVIAEYQSRWASEFGERLTAVQGVEDVLRSLTLPASVVSNSACEKVAFSLEVTGLVSYFDGRLFSALEVGRAKPEPDAYLHAAAEAGVAPEACLAIEDSAVGVRAAAHAGMNVIGFGRSHLRDAGARWVCTSMEGVGEVLHSVGKT